MTQSYPQNQPQIRPIHWTGASGTRYEFQLDLIGVVYKPIPGVYIFCKPGAGGFFDAIYIGETDHFWRRLTDELWSHHRWECIRARGATHISTLHVPGNAAARLAMETDLRRHQNPPCNLQ